MVHILDHILLGVRRVDVAQGAGGTLQALASRTNAFAAFVLLIMKSNGERERESERERGQLVSG